MSDLSLFNKDIWEEFGEVGSGVKKLFRGMGEDQRVAFFKPLTRRPGPTGANEYLAYKLGLLLDLSIAPTQLIKFGEANGSLSLGIGDSNPWQSFPDRENSKQFLSDESVFAKIIVFDMWIRTTDRHDRNLVFQSRVDKKYQLYMIDHEHSLYNAEEGPPSNFEDFTGIVKLKEMAKQLSGLDELLSQARKITIIENSVIINLVEEFLKDAPDFLNDAQAETIKKLLLKRKTILIDRLTHWYNGGEWKQ